MNISVKGFGKTSQGEDAKLFTLKNDNGMIVKITDFGASIVSIVVPDRNGTPTDVVLGFDTVEEYEKSNNFFGAFVGRNANRIAGAKCMIDGIEYKLDANDGANNLHSGDHPSNKLIYDSECYEDDEMVTVEFTRMSPDMEQGLPGNLDMTFSYSLTQDNELLIEYFANSDKSTVCNFTNHSYFNLNGHGSGSVLKHTCRIDADHFTPTDAAHIPTGEIKAVDGTPFDFRKAKELGTDIDSNDIQLKQSNGYDHNFCVKTRSGEALLIAELCGDTSGIKMQVFSDLPGVQLYTANYLDGVRGKKNCRYDRRSAVCFETQFYPNACNEPAFETSVLKAGESYDHVTIYKFI